MPKRVTTKRVATKEKYITPQYNTTHTKTELRFSIFQKFTRSISPKLHAEDSIVGQNADETRGNIKKVAVDVLENERKRVFPAIIVTRFAHRAVGWIAPEGLVVGATVVIACETESGWCPENQKGWRDPLGNSLGHDPQPSVGGNAFFYFGFGHPRQVGMVVQDW